MAFEPNQLLLRGFGEQSFKRIKWDIRYNILKKIKWQATDEIKKDFGLDRLGLIRSLKNF